MHCTTPDVVSVAPSSCKLCNNYLGMLIYMAVMLQLAFESCHRGSNDGKTERSDKQTLTVAHSAVDDCAANTNVQQGVRSAALGGSGKCHCQSLL